ncbi:MAG: hypothetical protein U5K37_07225 [Natrialbaceae archaeon]|nr:hypothetical protein [Natrialbaceae archaeon]
MLDPTEYESADAVDPLTELGAAIVEEIRTVEARPVPRKDLRVCMDAMDALLERHGPEPVFRLLHVTTSSIKRARGLGHVHIPKQRSHEWVGLLEPVCEAVLEVRRRDGRSQQRIHLRDRQMSSDWIRL